jgi:2,4-dienoyl-CoA reductase-like NADH-dependent reductase (Old Yellow Enzyme family)
VGPLYQAPFAAAIRREAGIATMAVGLITEPEQAEQVLAEGMADFVALGRAMLYNPRWPWHAAERLGAQAFYPLQYDRAHPSMRRNNAFVVQRER